MRTIYLLLIGVLSSSAWANLLVYPTRIILSDKERVANITLRHTGDKPQTYKMSLVFYEMKEDGTLDGPKKPGKDQRNGLELIRFSPRKTTLKPGLEQVLRVMSAARGNLPDGEYRAHLSFQPLDDKDDEEREVASTDKIKSQVELKVAVAVPVILRKGEPKFSVKLADAKVETKENASTLWVRLNTEGNAYPYGTLKATFTPNGGTPSELGVIAGMASYVPSRLVELPLKTAGKALGKGTLKVDFLPYEGDANTAPLASTQIALN